MSSEARTGTFKTDIARTEALKTEASLPPDAFEPHAHAPGAHGAPEHRSGWQREGPDKRATLPQLTLPLETKSPYVLRAAAIAASSSSFSHPLSPSVALEGTRMGHLLGLERTGVNLYRIAPGNESFAYHAHTTEEEWLYVLAGRGVALIDGEEHGVGPGDFMAFPTPSVAHHLTNPFDDELVYLAGGEHREVDVVDFPTLGQRIVRRGEDVTVYELARGLPLAPR